MKLAVVSDTHGKVQKADRALYKLGEIEGLLHVGDFYEDFLKLSRRLSLDVLAGVRGNCDQIYYPERLVMDILGYRILMVHGHQYNVKYNINSLKFAGQEAEADIVIFGHTHIAFSQTDWDNNAEKEVLFFNPGSVLTTRGKSSVGLIELDENQFNIHTEINKI